MYYNFGSIKYKYGTSTETANEGYYKSIINERKKYETSTNATGEQLFKTAEASGVRTLTLTEVNKALGRTDIDSTSIISTTEDSKGLYRLDQITSAPRISSISNSSGYYWIASPWPGNSYRDYIVRLHNAGEISGFHNYGYNGGIRTVVKLSGSNLKLEPVGTEGTYKFVSQ